MPPRCAIWCERLVVAALTGCVLFWFGAMFWLRGGVVPDWWLPAAFVIGLLLSWRSAPMPESGAVPRWLLITAGLAFVIAAAAVTYGAVATPSRHWDGAASFDAKVFWLTQAMTLQQPFFADPAVFHHSPDYPLLLPLLTAGLERCLGSGLGRLSMPLLYGLFAGLMLIVLQRRHVESRLALAAVIGAALTPALLGPGGGAVDSGYSELPLLLATTSMAGGLLLRSGRLLAFGVVIAVACKPEGLPYALVATLAAFVVGDRRMLGMALVALVAATTVWVPVQRALLHVDPPDVGSPVLMTMLAMVAAGAALIGLDALSRRTSHPGRWRWAVAFGGPAALLAAMPWLENLLPDNSALGVYLRQGALVFERMATLPAILLACADHAILRMHFGATFVLPLVAALALRRRGLAAAAGALPAFVMFGLLAVLVPFVLSPESDLQHHLRSSMPRLLLHWLGPAWLLVACQLQALLARPRDCAAGATTGS